MKLPGQLGHLTYSMLVHPADSWEELWASVNEYLPQVKARLSPDAPFGVCLRISAATAATLAGDAGERARLREFLERNDMYVYTVNAFPYGAFKGQRVKEQVYEPDWSTAERLQYTTDVATVLADICPSTVQPSIQTPPLAFKPNVQSDADVERITSNVLAQIAELVALERRSGRTVTLAIEPEPYCFLETTDETIAFFRERLYTAEAAADLAERCGFALSQAHAALRRHVGIVFDVCHQALEYEDVTESLGKLAEAGIPVLKLQAAAALRIPEVTQEIVERLARYAETVYLTQTLELREGTLTRYLNLEDAIAAWDDDPGPREWRVHIHVPVFLDDLGLFTTTRDAIEAAFALHVRRPISPHLEIETYTWDVLPQELTTDSIVDDVCRELEWLRDHMAAIAAGSAS